MSAPDRIFANPYYGMVHHQTSGIWTLENITGHGTEYIRLDPNTRIVTVDQLERWYGKMGNWTCQDEIRTVIGEVKP